MYATDVVFNNDLWSWLTIKKYIRLQLGFIGNTNISCVGSLLAKEDKLCAHYFLFFLGTYELI